MHTKKIQHFAEAAFWPAALLRRTSVLAESQNLGAGGIHFRRGCQHHMGPPDRQACRGTRGAGVDADR